MEKENKPVDFFEQKDVLGQNTPTFNSNKQNAETEYKDPYKDVIFPTLLTRVKALMIDVVVILGIFSIASLVIGEFDGAPNFVRGLIFVFSLYLYEPIFISIFGGTIGHNILKVKIRKINHQDKKLNIFQASLRFVTKYLLGWISFLTITANKRKRGIHDMTSGSIVLYKKTRRTNVE